MSEQRNPVRRRFRISAADGGIYIAFLLVVVVLSILSPTFRTLENLANIGAQSAILAIAAFAMTLVIISGMIDLSVGAVASLAGVVTASRLAAGDPILVAMTSGLIVAIAIGALNGAVVVLGRVPSFIATLSTFYVAQGLSLSITGGQTISFSAQGFRDVLATGNVFGLPAPVVWALIIGGMCWVLLHRTQPGADIFAVGGDSLSSRMLGIPVKRLRFFILTGTGALMGVVGMILVARIGNARSDGAIGLEFDAIAAVVIGGTSFAGGRGSITRTAVGVLFIGVLNNGLALLNVDFNTQQIIKGVLVVAAVLLDRLTNRTRT